MGYDQQILATTGLDDAIWRLKKLENDWKQSPPLFAEVLARFVMGAPGAIYGWYTDKDWMTGDELASWEKGLAILDVLPGGGSLAKLGFSMVTIKIGNTLIDLSKATRYAWVPLKCKEYAADFMSTIGKMIENSGGTVKKMSFRSNSPYGVYLDGKGSVTESYDHVLVEVTTPDGKVLIFDNNFQGITKDEYLKKVDIFTSDGPKQGSEAYNYFEEVK